MALSDRLMVIRLGSWGVRGCERGEMCGGIGESGEWNVTLT